MNKEELECKKNCQKYSNHIRRLLKQGKFDESAKLIDHIAQYLHEWEEYKKSVHLQFNMLRSLFVEASNEQRKAIIKNSNRRQ